MSGNIQSLSTKVLTRQTSEEEKSEHQSRQTVISAPSPDHENQISERREHGLLGRDQKKRGLLSATDGFQLDHGVSKQRLEGSCEGFKEKMSGICGNDQSNRTGLLSDEVQGAEHTRTGGNDPTVAVAEACRHRESLRISSGNMHTEIIQNEIEKKGDYNSRTVEEMEKHQSTAEENHQCSGDVKLYNSGSNEKRDQSRMVDSEIARTDETTVTFEKAIEEHTEDTRRNNGQKNVGKTTGVARLDQKSVAGEHVTDIQRTDIGTTEVARDACTPASFTENHLCSREMIGNKGKMEHVERRIISATGIDHQEHIKVSRGGFHARDLQKLEELAQEGSICPSQDRDIQSPETSNPSRTVHSKEDITFENSGDSSKQVVSSLHSSPRSERLKMKSAGIRLDLVADVKVEAALVESVDSVVKGKGGDIVANIKDWLRVLQTMERFSTQGALEILKGIANCHWQHPDKREEIVSAVNSHGGAEILLNILVSLGKEGLFKRNSVWYPANYCYNVVWNLSDGGGEFAASLGRCGMIGLCATNIAHRPYLENMHKKNVLFLLKASLSILHNISLVQSVRHKFREVGLVQKLVPYTSTDQKYLKALCMLILANIVDEDQESLLDEKGTIEFLIQLLKEAQASEDRRAQGLSCAELANGLGRLAVHDANKVKILSANGLPPFINMLESTDLSEQEAATQALWSLSFDPSICKLLSTNEKALTSLRALQSSGNTAVEMSAKGALWMLRQHRKSLEDECSVDGKKKVRAKSSRQSSLRRIHVMISYQWSSQKTVLKIRDDLVAAGYIVWVDVDKMCGSTLQAMAEAVERAAAVIICMSEGYKMSPNCRTEAEYAYQLQKWIIPLMMDMYYEPDGWLGLILGAKYYMDFSGTVPYEESSQKLIRELDSSKSSFDAPDSVFDEVEAVITKSTAATCGSSAGPINWSEEDVQNWLKNHNLERYKASFEGCNGKLLLQLRSLRLEAPEFFYRSLKEDLGISGIFNILRFTEALEDIR